MVLVHGKDRVSRLASRASRLNHSDIPLESAEVVARAQVSTPQALTSASSVLASQGVKEYIPKQKGREISFPDPGSVRCGVM